MDEFLHPELESLVLIPNHFYDCLFETMDEKNSKNFSHLLDPILWE
jgi:hypothetical protein